MEDDKLIRGLRRDWFFQNRIKPIMHKCAWGGFAAWLAYEAVQRFI